MAYRYFIKLAYDGSSYHGWQVQQNAVTVQEVITKAIRLIWSEDFAMVGCGRTDTGVHAKEYYAHFDMETEKSRNELDQLAYRLNCYLSKDIVIYDIFPVPHDLHARFSAISRTYEYHIHTNKDPFLNEHSWYVYKNLDIGLMNAGAEILKEYEDFTSFTFPNIKRKTNICQVYGAVWEMSGHRLIFTITADRFLHNMVRSIVGTLLLMGQKKISIEDLRQIIEAKNRSHAGETVPAKGLYLTRVDYPGFQ